MTYRPTPKYATKDATAGAWTTCDRCGLIDNQSRMQWQYDFQGGPVPINRNLLFCPRCLDGLRYQNQPIIIPPDPPPLFNTRPEPYAVDETNWLLTEDDEIIDTQSGEDIIVNQPNPSNEANTAPLIATVDADGQSVGTLYLDLFNGNPTTSGYSVLSAITGSATRTNIGSSLTTTNEVATNPDVVTVASASAATINVNWIAFYSAASSGTLLMYAPVAVALTGGVALGTTVQFNALDLVITEAGGGADMASESGVSMVSQTSVQMITE